MKNLIFGIALFGLVCSCSRANSTAKEAINKSGEIVGKGASEFIEGINEGVDKTFECELVLSSKLSEKGIQTGKFSINNDSMGGYNNILSVYLIFNKDFKGEIMAKANDSKGLEFGRKKMEVEAKAGDAKHIDFAFDKRTHIEAKSKISIE